MKNTEMNSTCVQTTIVTGFYTSVATGLIAMDIVADALLRHVPKTSLWYLFAIVFAAGILYVAQDLLKDRQDYDVLIDLCFYDLLIQIFGLVMRLANLNPPEPDPLPYKVLTLAMVWFKAVCVIWPLYINSTWPVIGPFSYLKRKRINNQFSLFVSVAELELSPVLVRCVVFVLPVLLITLAYIALLKFGDGLLGVDIRFPVGAYMAFLSIKQALASMRVAEQIDQDR